MTSQREDLELDPAIRDLYPTQSEDWLRKAEENLERYLSLVLRIYQRIQEEPEAQTEPQALTASVEMPTLEQERSNNGNKSSRSET